RTPRRASGRPRSHPQTQTSPTPSPERPRSNSALCPPGGRLARSSRRGQRRGKAPPSVAAFHASRLILRGRLEKGLEPQDLLCGVVLEPGPEQGLEEKIQRRQEYELFPVEDSGCLTVPELFERERAVETTQEVGCRPRLRQDIDPGIRLRL